MKSHQMGTDLRRFEVGRPSQWVCKSVQNEAVYRTSAAGKPSSGTIPDHWTGFDCLKRPDPSIRVCEVKCSVNTNSTTWMVHPIW